MLLHGYEYIDHGHEYEHTCPFTICTFFVFVDNRRIFKKLTFRAGGSLHNPIGKKVFFLELNLTRASIQLTNHRHRVDKVQGLCVCVCICHHLFRMPQRQINIYVVCKCTKKSVQCRYVHLNKLIFHFEIIQLFVILHFSSLVTCIHNLIAWGMEFGHMAAHAVNMKLLHFRINWKLFKWRCFVEHNVWFDVKIARNSST